MLHLNIVRQQWIRFRCYETYMQKYFTSLPWQSTGYFCHFLFRKISSRVPVEQLDYLLHHIIPYSLIHIMKKRHLSIDRSHPKSPLRGWNAPPELKQFVVINYTQTHGLSPENQGARLGWRVGSTITWWLIVVQTSTATVWSKAPSPPP